MKDVRQKSQALEQAREDTEREYRQRDQADLVDVLSGVQGRRVLQRIIGITGWFAPPVVYGNKRDDIETGRRSIGGEIYGMIQELGMPGLELAQLAQREYVLTQIEKQTLIDMIANKEERP